MRITASHNRTAADVKQAVVDLGILERLIPAAKARNALSDRVKGLLK